MMSAYPTTLGACRPRVCNRLRKCTAVLGGAGPPESQGDPNVQEGLVQMVRLQIGKEKVKDSVEEEKLKLQQLAEEVLFVKASSLSLHILYCLVGHRHQYLTPERLNGSGKSGGGSVAAADSRQINSGVWQCPGETTA